ncbi:Fructosamine/Ketosamine-3-kinase [Flammula alnicola]|nr:Fructosamine/Ketosamine-3-kinase [Flammula alnicola]
MSSHIPQAILQKLRELDSNASFSGSLPRVQSSSGAIFYAKLGSPSDDVQYTGEAESLKAIAEAAPSLAPRILSFGVLDSGAPYFISEYKDIGLLSYGASDILAKRMATELHAKPSSSGLFGFSIPTYCGVTRLQNGWFRTWDECYSSMIGDLLGQLERKGRYQNMCRKGESIKSEVIPKLLGSLDIKPVILHGDLWSGNAGVDKATGQPIIFDPASYYGHNEADLSIARIFGGFPDSFFKTYHQHIPKTEPVDQYELRMDLYELFHYLNHTLIFGGHYSGSAERKMDKLMAALPEL